MACSLRTLLMVIMLALAASSGAAVAGAPYHDTPLQGTQQQQSSSSQTPSTSTNGNGTATSPAVSPVAKQWGSTCWTCGLYEAVNEARKTYGKAIFDQVAASLVPLVTAVLGVWLLLQAGRLLMPFGPMDGGARALSSVLIRILLTIALLVLARNYTVFWTLQNAAIDAGLKGSRVIMEAGLDAFPVKGGIKDDGCQRSNATTPAPVTTSAAPGLDMAAIESERDAALRCTLGRLQSSLGVGMDLGVSLLNDVISKPFWAILQAAGFAIPVVGAGVAGAAAVATGGESAWVLMRFVAGLALVGIFGLAAFLAAFRFIDVIVKWTVVTILAPFFMVMFLFPKTRQMFWSGFKIILADTLALLFLAVILALMVSFFSYVLSVDATNAKSLQDISSYQLKRGIAEPVFWQILTIGLMTLGLMSQVGSWAGFAVSLPALLQVPALGNKMADMLQGAAGNLLQQARGWRFDGNYRRRGKLNDILRGEMLKPRDYATRKAQNKLLIGEK